MSLDVQGSVDSATGHQYTSGCGVTLTKVQLFTSLKTFYTTCKNHPKPLIQSKYWKQCPSTLILEVVINSPFWSHMKFSIFHPSNFQWLVTFHIQQTPLFEKVLKIQNHSVLFMDFQNLQKTSFWTLLSRMDTLRIDQNIMLKMLTARCCSQKMVSSPPFRYYFSDKQIIITVK